MNHRTVSPPLSEVTAAAALAEAHNWEINNYELNIRLYYLQLFHAAQFNAPLVAGEFSRYLHGPKLRKIYNKFKMFEAGGDSATSLAAGNLAGG